jgi:hypothetical protein
MSELTPAQEARNAAILAAIERADQEERERIKLAKYQRQALQLTRRTTPYGEPGYGVPDRELKLDKAEADRWWEVRDVAREAHLTIPIPHSERSAKPFDRWGTAEDFLEIAWCKGPPACSGSPHSDACRAGAYRQRKRFLR